jgi:hypothetical protein
VVIVQIAVPGCSDTESATTRLFWGGRIQLPGVAVVVALADVNALPLRPGLDRQRPILEKVLVGRLAEVTEVDRRGNP